MLLTLPCCCPAALLLLLLRRCHTPTGLNACCAALNNAYPALLLLPLLPHCHVQLRDYKPGSCRADLEEARAAARAQQGLEPDSDEVRQLLLGASISGCYTSYFLPLGCCTQSHLQGRDS
jgi:hypothetical protein